MKLYISIALLFLNLNNLKSQDFEQIANYVNSLKHEDSIEVLTNKLVEPYQKEIDKTASIFYWIAKSIKYDFAGYENDFWKYYQSDEKLIKDTYNFKKGVCSGYAHLFKYMLSICNIESVTISGFSRIDLNSLYLEETNHDWNSVKIDGKWCLFDVTWGWNVSESRLRTFYFNTSPEIFILNHFPIETEWTLLGNKYTKQNYFDFPLYTTDFHEIRFTKDISKNGYIKAINDTVLIDLKPTKDYLVSVKLYDYEKKEWFTPLNADQTRKDGKIKFYLERKGEFIMKISALLLIGSNGYRTYDELIYYRIQNE